MISKARLATFIAVPLILLGGALAYAHQQGHHGPGDGQHMDRHLDQMAKMLTTIGASEAQKTRIDGILRNAFTSLAAARNTHHQAFGQFHEMLFAPSIDRVKIEELRVGQIQAMDAVSREFAAAFVDAAEVLSPEQRVALAQEIRSHHGH